MDFFEISARRAVTRHGVINWEEFGEKFWWVVLCTHVTRKCPQKFVHNFAQFFTQTSTRVIKACRHNFALGNVRRNESSPKNERTEPEPETGTARTVFFRKPQLEPGLSIRTLLKIPRFQETLSPEKPLEPKTGTAQTGPRTNRNRTELWSP